MDNKNSFVRDIIFILVATVVVSLSVAYLVHEIFWGKSPVDNMLTYDGKYHTPARTDTVGVVTNYGSAGIVRVVYSAAYSEDLFESGIDAAIAAAVKYAIVDLVALSSKPYPQDELFNLTAIVESNVIFLMSATLENLGFDPVFDFTVQQIMWPKQFVMTKGVLG